MGRMIIDLVGIVLIVSLALALALSVAIPDRDMWYRGYESARRDAIEAGVAEYYFDKYADKQFRWKPGKEE